MMRLCPSNLQQTSPPLPRPTQHPDPSPWSVQGSFLQFEPAASSVRLCPWHLQQTSPPLPPPTQPPGPSPWSVRGSFLQFEPAASNLGSLSLAPAANVTTSSP